MRRIIRPFRSFLMLPIVIFISAAVIPGKNIYTLDGNYSVTINGTSNLHSWNETVENVSGSGVVTWNTNGSLDLDSLKIRMKVHSIKSDAGSIMNNNTYKALKADAYPEIIFTLKAPVKSIQTNSSVTIVTAKGYLTIAGVSRPVEISAKVFFQEHDKLVFQGNETIKMTDYGVDPPTALFGTLRTGNEVIIKYKTSFILSS
jgi:polyisoprenoid-binding protein YceI